MTLESGFVPYAGLWFRGGGRRRGAPGRPFTQDPITGYDAEKDSSEGPKVSDGGLASAGSGPS